MFYRHQAGFPTLPHVDAAAVNKSSRLPARTPHRKTVNA